MKKYFVVALALLCLMAFASCEMEKKTELHVPEWAIGTYKSDDNHRIEVTRNGFVIDGKNVIPKTYKEMQESEDSQTYAGMKQYTVAFVSDGYVMSVGIADSKYVTIIAYVHNGLSSTYTCTK